MVRPYPGDCENLQCCLLLQEDKIYLNGPPSVTRPTLVPEEARGCLGGSAALPYRGFGHNLESESNQGSEQDQIHVPSYGPSLPKLSVVYRGAEGAEKVQRCLDHCGRKTYEHI